jgi:putative two-component system response regulator
MNGQTRPVILIGDAAAENLIQLSGVLQERYDIKLADSGNAVLRVAQQLPRPELMLLDAGLADPGSFDTLRQLRSIPDTAAIPVIMMVEAGDYATEQRCLLAGAAEVLTRPLQADTVLARVGSQFELLHAHRLLKHQRHHLEHLVQDVTHELTQMADAVIWAMATLAELRDNETPNHLSRMQHYVQALARKLQHHPRFAAELSDNNIRLLFNAAPLHDIGKVAIPDAILLKPGRLTPEEFEVVKMHTVYGRDAIAGVEDRMGGSNTFLRFAREIAYSHQEKFDGSGYPQGLAGEDIPVSARLLAVADVYDALISKRVYKPAFTHETAIELIRQGSGEHFDPDVVDAMLSIEEEFMNIAMRFQDDTDKSLLL